MFGGILGMPMAVIGELRSERYRLVNALADIDKCIAALDGAPAVGQTAMPADPATDVEAPVAASGSGSIVARLASHLDAVRDAPVPARKPLSALEMQVLLRRKSGQRNRWISAHLHRTENAIEQAVARIRAKGHDIPRLVRQPPKRIRGRKGRKG